MTDKFFLAGMGAIRMVSFRSGMSNEGRRVIDSTLEVMLRDFRQALEEGDEARNDHRLYAEEISSKLFAATKEVEEVDEINHFLLRKNAEMLDRLVDLND